MSKSKLLTVELGDHGDTVLARASGEVDMGTAPILRDGLESAVTRAGAQPMVVLDLLEVDFLASAGLALLVEYHTRCRDLGGELRVLAERGPVFRAIEVTSLDQVLAIYPALSDAVKGRVNAADTAGTHADD